MKREHNKQRDAVATMEKFDPKHCFTTSTFGNSEFLNGLFRVREKKADLVFSSPCLESGTLLPDSGTVLMAVFDFLSDAIPSIYILGLHHNVAIHFPESESDCSEFIALNKASSLEEVFEFLEANCRYFSKSSVNSIYLFVLKLVKVLGDYSDFSMLEICSLTLGIVRLLSLYEVI